MNVLHVLAPAPFGGLEQVVLTLADAQREAGHSVHVAAIMLVGERESALIGQLRARSIPVHVLSFPPRAYRRQIQEIRALRKELDASVVHTHGSHPDVIGSFMQAPGVALVSTAHGFTGAHDLKTAAYEWVQMRGLRRFGGIIAVSRAIVMRLETGGCRSDRIHLLPNAWRPLEPPVEAQVARARLQLPEGAFSVGWIGRMSYEKGLDVLLDAIARVPRSQAFRLTAIGDGRERPALEQAAANLEITDRVSFAGGIPNAARLMQGFDLLVISSRTEGTPMTLLEAMSAGVPVVTTAVGGIPDVVSNAEAVLVPPEDPAALATAIQAVLDDRLAAAARAARAKQRLAAAYDVTAWVRSHDAVYASAGARSAVITREDS